MQNSFYVPDNKSFPWKKGDSVPGRPVSNVLLVRDTKNISPKKSTFNSKHHKTSSASSFQEFQDSTDDAWDVSEDDICLSSTDIPFHSQVAQSTAIKVLSNHSKGTLQFPTAKNFSSCSKVTNDQPSSKVSGNENQNITLNNSNNAKVPASQNFTSLKNDISFKECQQSSPSRHYSGGSVPGPGNAVRQTQQALKQSLCYSQSVPLSNSIESDKRSLTRLHNFENLLKCQNVDLKELRNLSWNGIPENVRPTTWKLLSGYLTASLERRESFLQRKKDEYHAYIGRYYEKRNEDVHHETYRQIHIDVPRMSPLVPLFQQEIVQLAFERILYILAIRYPASGYVQGMNDLVTPFFVVFLQEFIPSDADAETYDVSTLPAEVLQQIEADSYWCMSKLLEGILDNYTFAQPGIQKKVNTLKELIQRVDAPLHVHLKTHSIEYLQFSFRWMNNLLMRELPLKCTIRLWDTYLSETNGFSNFHLYVCAAFLKHWSKDLLQQKDFQGLMLMLQNLPTLQWKDENINLLVAEAYKLKYMFDDAPNHLQPTET